MRDLRLYFNDILAAMLAVQEFVNGISFETFLEDEYEVE